MIARPTRKEGLTGEKAAKLLWQDSWGELGIPAIITTDQDTRFVSYFFNYLVCADGLQGDVFASAQTSGKRTSGSGWQGN